MAGFAACISAAYAYQREFREFPGEDQLPPVTPDQLPPSEFVWGRLMYPSGGGGGRFFGGFGRDWRNGGGNWTNDYPAGDRHLMTAVRRLTRIDARPIEQPINLEDEDDVFNWPMLYAVRTTNIQLTDAMTAKLREYLDRGGFFIADDMWGPREQGRLPRPCMSFTPSASWWSCLTTRWHSTCCSTWTSAIRSSANGPGTTGCGRSTVSPTDPHFKGVFDDKGRMTIAVWFNNDTGDSWEWADDPSYPEKFSALGIRVALNQIVYAMTH